LSDIKLFPDLFPAAHRAGEGALLRVWYLARATGAESGFRVRYAELVAEIVRCLAVKERYAVQLLERGADTWWRLDHKHGLINLSGVKAVCARLGGPLSNAPAVHMPRATLARLGHFYAYNYAAYMQRYVKGDRSLPVARAALQAIFGVTRNTLRRWEKAAGVIVLGNLAFAPPSLFRSLPDKRFEFHCACGQAFNTSAKYTWHRDGKLTDGVTPDPHPCRHKEYFLVWERPNSYAPPAMPTSGTASPICRSRMTTYTARLSRHPDAPKCHYLSSSATQPLATHNDLPGVVTFHYRKARVSDPLPVALVRAGVPLARLTRAVRIV